MAKATAKVVPAILFLGLAASCSVSAATLYVTTLSGANEAPPNASTATGTATVTLSGDSLTVFETFTGLASPATGAHIHCCSPVGVNSTVAVPFTAFPSTTSDVYNMTFDLTMLSTYNAAFVTANGGTAATAEAALIAGLNGGMAYANIHDRVFPGGEIRGQLTATPEPGSAGFMLLGLPVLLAARRRFSAR